MIVFSFLLPFLLPFSILVFLALCAKDDLDGLERIGETEAFESLLMPEVLRAVKKIVREAGHKASIAPDDFKELRELFAAQDIPNERIEQFVSAGKRWETECRRKLNSLSVLAAKTDTEGVLEKQGEHNLAFKSRWFELRGSKMRVRCRKLAANYLMY